MKNLFLKYRFTDRGGRKVYEIYDSEDIKRLLHPLGEARFPNEKDDVIDGKGNAAITWIVEEDVNDRLAADYNPDQLELDV